jgi:hypothetical protein
VRPLNVHSWFSRCLKEVAPGHFSLWLRIQLKEMDVTPSRPVGKFFPRRERQSAMGGLNVSAGRRENVQQTRTA